MTTEADDATGSGSGTDPGDDVTDFSDTTIPGPLGTAYVPFAVIPLERPSELWGFDEDDNNQRRTIRVDDYITVELEYPLHRQVTYLRWSLGGASSRTMIGNHSFERTTSVPDDYIIRLEAEFAVYEPGDCSLQIISYHESDGEHHIWQVYLTVTE